VADATVGIDLGASRIDVVSLTGTGPAWSTIPATEIDTVVERVRAAAMIAIDAPAELSTAPHRHDGAVNAKFRTARCGEIALGEQARVWVPWVTPADPALVPPWMEVGFALWRALRAAGHDPLEVYPAGAFHALAGTRLPRKTTAAGRRARLEILATAIALPASVAHRWTHDALDACAAAVTASHHRAGTARRFGHAAPTCDASSIWLPAAP
jgi:predicted nuclease with RNAse H fold